MPTAADLAARVSNLYAILFSEFLLVGLVAALAVLLVGRVASVVVRERLLLAASVAVLVWFAGPRASLAIVGWTLAFHACVELGVGNLGGRLAAVALLVVFVVAPVAAIAWLGEGPPHAREFVAFATNMAILRFVAFARERWRGEIERTPLDRALLAFFFFPTFVNGPVETPRAVLGAPAGAVGGTDVAAGLARVGAGMAKILLAALVMPLAGPRALAETPHAPAIALWGWAVLFYVWFFLSFSAWSDVAIGLGRLCGRGVAENFDRPWRATDPGDFWRRWHVSFGRWLRDVVYIPLGGNRRHRTANVFAVFLVSAAWHVWGTLKLLGFGYYPVSAWGGFALWAVLHATAVTLAGRPAAPGARGTIARIATFLFASFAWVPFFAPVPMATLLRLLARMLVPVVP